MVRLVRSTFLSIEPILRSPDALVDLTRGHVPANSSPASTSILPGTSGPERPASTKWPTGPTPTDVDDGAASARRRRAIAVFMGAHETGSTFPRPSPLGHERQPRDKRRRCAARYRACADADDEQATFVDI